MKNHRDLVGLGANILIAALILIIIIVGLNKMGLYNLPEPIENLLNPQSVDERNQSIDEDKIYNSAHFDADEYGSVSRQEVTYENARAILEKIVNKYNYRHEISVTHSSDTTALTREVVLEKKDGLYSAQVFTDKAVLIEQYSDSEDTVTAHKYQNGSLAESMSFPKGSFTVPELCSVIADHSSFLDGTYELQKGSFAVIQGDFGTELEITFDTALDNYTQTEIYRVNVDYGIVTQAECVENGKVVYLMQTLSLKELSN